MTNPEIIAAYKDRTATIRELAAKNNCSYECIRKLLVEADYSNTKKKPLVKKANRDMSDQEIVDIYATRQQTIREIAGATNRTYQAIRRIMTNAGFSNGKRKSRSLCTRGYSLFLSF